MIDILVGDCLDTLKTLPEKPVNTCVTSPPYYGLRDYKVDGQIGLEASPDEYIANLVKAFGEVKRVLKDDGTLWVNIGDSYARNPAKGGSGPGGKNREWYGEGYTSARSEVRRVQRNDDPGMRAYGTQKTGSEAPEKNPLYSLLTAGVKEKDLIGIPWMLAFAPEGGVVLDPFGGSGTTAGVAVKNNRKAILCELNEEYTHLVADRVKAISGYEMPHPLDDLI